jgi:hypothetical protein
VSDLAPWQARAIPAAEVPRAHVNQYRPQFYNVPGFHSPGAFALPGQWNVAWAARLVAHRQSHPCLVSFASGFGDNQSWSVHRLNSAWATALALRLMLNQPPQQNFDFPPNTFPTRDDEVHALAVDHVGLVGTRWSAPANPLPSPESAAWSLVSTTAMPGLFLPVAPAGTPSIVIGSTTTASASWPSIWHGPIYWVEMRAGLIPGEGPILWRWDAAEYDAAAASQLDWTDPRGRVWRNQAVQHPTIAVPRIDLGLPAPRRATVSRVTERIFTGTGAPGTLPNQTPGDRYIDTENGDVWTLLAPTRQNLLYSDQQASIETGSTDPGAAANPVAGYFGWASPQANPRTTAQARHGSSSLAMMRSDGSAGSAQANPQSSASTTWPGRYPFVAGQTYTLMASVWAPPGGEYDTIGVSVAGWRDAQGATVTGPPGVLVPARGYWHDVRYVLTAPAGAVDGAPLFTVYVGPTEVGYLDRVGLFAGDAPSEEWVLPSEYRPTATWSLTHPAAPVGTP